ncbi:related to TRA1 - component of the Ada-Spt transcriptional regulatory complex [Melanopsichium pennsylvanicum]|uniref:Related to TRA1 - component of the Ada-Spt transcriptional regulatory complex n=2 Tax=Melanopsichium pennsylvanicum TaxID=63383 RepID=A0AAJ4XP26_9BASI|nr:related to TRA1-component of the Ada-Spt transcriptional regulatory complex (N-terminal fragment) [Melanopsichium pennsylvanicum 4]SNX86514.1 related to TRA1 - component of the Ada-Spt transcriptional regulatory complex [Melanopsichium pennsylvanicum]
MASTDTTSRRPMPDVEQLAIKLSDKSTDAKQKLATAFELKELLDLFQNLDYALFLKHVVPAFVASLNSIPCSFIADAPEQRLRHILLETTHRLPQQEVLKPYADSLMTAMLNVLRDDNEDNAVLALKVIIDLHRSFKAVLQDQVQPFLELVKTLYTNMNNTVQHAFESDASQQQATAAPTATLSSINVSPAPPATTTNHTADTSASTTSAATAASTNAAPHSASNLSATPTVANATDSTSTASTAAPATSTPTPSAPPTSTPIPSSTTTTPATATSSTATTTTKTLPKSMSSFKVLTECPIVIVLIFQSYRSVVPQAINVFVPLIIESCLSLQAKPQREAHEAAKARGEIFVGVAPGIKNRSLYTDMIVAQVKTMSFLAYVLRGSAPVMRPFAQKLPKISVRLLKDCPPEASATRKELLVATRHVLSTEYRAHFVGQIDTLLDERVLIGTGVTSHETQRPLAISMLADLVHHVRQELSPAQLVRVVHIHSRILHDPTLAPSIQTMCVKLLLNLVETILTKHPEGATQTLASILDVFVEKLSSLHRLRSDMERIRQIKDQSDQAAANTAVDAVAIERGKPIQAAATMLDTAGDPLKDARFLFRNILFGFKTLIPVLRHRNAAHPDGAMAGKLLVDGVKCWSLHEDRDGREEKEVLDLFTTVFIDLEPQVFHDVFTTHMPFLFQEMLNAPTLLGIPQNLLSNDAVSKRFVGILLRFLVDRLEELGKSDKKHASISLRLFKMAFMAVTIFPEENEVVLQPHLSHLIMESMKLASKADEPTNYFLLLRALFRSIGGGRFELLYKDVLPLLPVLLENLNALLNAAEPSRREVFVDLCLTVPVRLSVLLPYLGYLMKPLVLALQSSTELVSQGLRTLELCIDNLTQEFLDPIMAPYAQDIMAALWQHLQPLPHNHQHSHTTMRILGKMGGRNRKLLQNPPRLSYVSHKACTFPVHLDDKPQSMTLTPVTELALANITRTDSHYRRHAFELLRHTAALFLDGSLMDADRETVFGRLIKGLFDATRSDDLKDEAVQYLFGICKHVFHAEIKREMPTSSGGSSRHLWPMTTSLLEGLTNALALNEAGNDPAPFIKLQLQIIRDFLTACEKVPATRPDLGHIVMHSFASKFCSQCYEQLWQRKTGGWLGVDMLVRRADLGQIWVRDHQLEIVRALLFMLKDMPNDPPGNIDEVSETLLQVIRQAYAVKAPAADGKPETPVPERPSHLTYLIGILVPELSSSNATVRITTQTAFKLLAELRKCTVTELLTPQKDRLLQPIFTKPLRALPFGMQIGHIDAITFALNLSPPLPEFNEELYRVLTEALALADADDQALIGRTSQYKNMIAVTKLRVVAIRLLSSAMACGDFLSAKHTQMRMKIISVYFKSLYSRSEEVVQVAYESLKTVLSQQSKLPKDLLQSGLRPILMTLADRNRLTASGLEGLARLLQLLTNYFKVEIGTKLLDHLTSLAEPAVLHRAAAGSLRDNEQIKTLVAIVNVFRLLPEASFQFLPRLTTTVAEIESQLRRAGPTPFTKPLTLFLNRFAEKAVTYFFDGDKLSNLKFLRVVKLSLASDDGPELRSQVTTNREKLLFQLFANEATAAQVQAGISIVQQLVERDPQWLVTNKDVFEKLIALWNSPASSKRRREEDHSSAIKAVASPANPAGTTVPAVARNTSETKQLIELFLSYLRIEPHVEAYVAVLDAYTYKIAFDLTFATRFIYDHLCVKASGSFKRQMFSRFLMLFEDKQASQTLKTQALRVLINPMLLASYGPHPTSSPAASPKPAELAIADKSAASNATAAGSSALVTNSGEKDGDVEMKDADGKKPETAASTDATSTAAAGNASASAPAAAPVIASASASTDAARPAEAEDAAASADKPKVADDADVIDADLVTQIANRMWKPFQNPKAANELCSDDALRIELLHMSTMILEHCSDHLAPNGQLKKDTIKFGWANLTAEDVTVKNVAYIFIARFLEVFESPIKIVGQVYFGLLRAHQSEGRSMVKKALDILVPALPKRAGASESGQPPQWAKWTKRQLVDEGHNVSQLFAILSLLVRHADLFYSSREMFIPQIVSNLTKLGLVANVNVESRMLAVDLVELLHKWEKRRQEHVRSQQANSESTTMDSTAEVDAAAGGAAKRGLDAPEETAVKKVRIDETGISASASKSASPAGVPAPSTAASATAIADAALSPADHEYLMPMNLREMTVGFLVRFVSLSMEPISKAGIVSKAANLLSETLKAPYWSDVQVRLSIFQRPLIHTEINDQNTPVICNALRTLQIVVEDKTDAYIAPHVPQLQKLLEKSASTDEVSLVEAQKPVLERIFRVIPDPPPEEDVDGEAEMDTGDDKKPDEDELNTAKEAKESEATDELAAFRKFADNLIADGLKQSQHLYSVFSMLDAWSQSKPEKIDAHLPALSKALSKLTKEHLAATSPVPANDPNLKLLMLVLELLKRRISNLGDQRRWLLSALVQLVERSSSLELCRFLLSTMSKWILEQREAFPTVKEKAGILLKMMSFESRDNDQLLRDYLDLIHAIYTTPAFARTELTVRLENAFLLGCRQKDAQVRQKFIDIFDRTLVRGAAGRLQYLLGHQSWEYLAEHYWISQVLDLMLSTIDTNWPLLSHSSLQLGKGASSFVPTLKSLQVGDMISSIRALLYTDKDVAHQIWTSFFAAAWRSMSRKNHDDITRALVGVLTREYNLRQVSKRPNVVQTLLEGALACKPQLELPPHVVKYLGRNFNAWHTSIELLQNLLRSLPRQDDAIREAGQDALTELYAELSEEDMFYGLWRRRCVYAETNSAISFEQIGMWNQAQVQYETAQVKARSGVLNFTEAEYHLWEDQWVFCAQKLQQWDILTDLAKMEADNDLLLECAWRLSDWTTERETLEQALESLSASATPRRRVFEAYMALLKSQSGQDKPAEFGRICDEAIQLTLKKWHSLPTAVTVAHVPLLQIFQQFVELQEASTIFASLAHTNATNLDQRSAELKAQMQTWRERLPNLWDDINAWSDLVAWRQHVFGAINKAYLPLVPVIQQRDGQNASTNSYAYRGYHETAWIINRFAHVARKHYLNDVCISSLTKIYTLPNIEIQEAFLKLREQAKCHFQNPNELTQGLDVINNTNLMFFAAPQKAEFFTLKGMFMARLGLNDEANHAFATAIQMDLNLAKAWTEWGRYNDRLFRDRPNELSAAGNAVSCYLQAAGLYKNAKVRKVLIRVLWLLSCDDSKGTVWQAFEGFKGDAPIWYWITFIPQLLQSLSHKEARFARKMLMSIAKTFPQSLYFYLRTTKEDFVAMKRQSLMAAQRAAQQQARQAAAAAAAAQNSGKAAEAGETPGADANATGSPAKTDGATPANNGDKPATPTAVPGVPTAAAAAGATPNTPRQPWEYVDEILNILKTAFPLLTLTMENIAEQIQQRFKPTNEEDIYRLTNALLNDALQQYIQRAVSPNDSGVLPASSQANVIRFAENLPPGPLKTSFEEDFVKSKPTLRDYVSKLQRWRDRYETSLDRRPSKQHLEHCSHYLVEFQHQKFDEVEVPGQYLKLEDNNSDFVKIARFMPVFEMVRSSGMCTRRLTVLSNKGTMHSFAVQLPSGRYCRREERIFQLLRFFNRVLERRKETRKRGLAFHVPLALPLAPQVRLIDHDAGFVSLQDIYERHCEDIGIGKDDPVIAWVEKMRSTWDGGVVPPVGASSSSSSNTLTVGAGGGTTASSAQTMRGNVDFTNLRMDLMEEISTKYVPDTVLSRYLIRSMPSPSDLYMLRKQFTIQKAASSFVTYCLFVSNRLPNRIHISRSSGQVSMSDVVPTFNPTAPQFKSTDPTPFRLSPNLQNFIGPIGIEGVLTSALMALGRTLTEPDRNLEEYLGIFVRDEINFWLQGAQRQAQAQQAVGSTMPNLVTEAPKEVVLTNVFEIVKRAKLISCRQEFDKLQQQPNGSVGGQTAAAASGGGGGGAGTTPVSSVVLDLINSASNPSKLALQDPTWGPWL